MYGHTVGGPVGIGYVRLGEGETPSEELFGSQTFHVEVASQRYPAQVSLAPFYDPKGERLKV
jgi:4-methylaminobutanoate oxidase (formaldehyde-forming)